MLKNLLLVFSHLFSYYSMAQINDEEYAACHEKCSHAQLRLAQQRVAYYQYPSMNKYDVKYLKLDIAVETNSRNISGTALTRVKSLQSLDSFIIEFTSSMILDSVFVNNIKHNFSRGSDYIFITLSPAVPADAVADVLFHYHGTASSRGVFAGIETSNGLKYSSSLSESYHARDWFPSKQILNDKIDSVDIWITTDAANKAGSNGLLVAEIDKPNNKKQFQWKCRYPMNYYMPSFSVGNYMEYRNYAKPAAIAPDSILVQHYLVNNPSFFNNNKANIDKTPVFIEKMSELFGLYPFSREKYGHSQSGTGIGIEHQTMSTVDVFDLWLINHELAHQWFGDNVTCATWNHIWLNEGFASYSEYLMIEKISSFFSTTPATYMQNFHTPVLSSPNGSVFVPDASIYDENRIFNSRLTYFKGAAIVHTLRFEMQDDSAFFTTLKKFQQLYKDSVATANDFKQVAENTSGKNFTDFFNQWYYGEGYPSFNVVHSKQGDSIVLLINQTVSAPTVTPFFKGLYEFTINSPQGDTTVRVYQTENNQTFKFRSFKTPSGIVVDPNNWVLNKVGSITTGINDPLDVSKEVKLYPNPSSGFIYLQYRMNDFDNLKLFDITGKLLLEKKISRGSTQQTINKALLPGIYLVQLNGKGKVAIKKLATIK